MASITPGLTTFGEVFSKGKFDVASRAVADYNNGNPDFRRVQVGGLPYGGDPDEAFIVPATADELVITLDGEEAVRFDIKHTATTKAEKEATLRELSGEGSSEASHDHAEASSADEE